MSNQVIHALYDDDDTLLSAVKEVRAEKHHIEEIYTPFPVHGLDKAMGLAETRIAIMAFIYGCIGFSVAIIMINLKKAKVTVRLKTSFFVFQNKTKK